MTTLYGLLGAAALVVICVAIAIFTLDKTRDLVDYATMRIYRAGYEAGKRGMVLELHDKAWWYSEHTPTFKLLQRIIDQGNWECREERRKNMEAAERGEGE